jgi:short-subunit dehydrogenase
VLEKPTIIIFGAGSSIARNTFKNIKDYNIIGFTRFSKLSAIKEYKVHRYNKFKSLNRIISNIKSNKIILIFMETLSISNLIINKNKNELMKEINANIISPHNIIKSILPKMLKNRWGRIVFCGSSRALKTDSGISGYVAGKYATLGYCKVLSKEYARFGITSNYLSLGLFNSTLFEQLTKSTKRDLIKNTDTRSIGDYKSIYNAINFIINSNYVTGSIIPVDGGFN